MSDELQRLRHSRDEWRQIACQVLQLSADEIQRLRDVITHGLTKASVCLGCAMCEELKAIHKQAVSND